MEKVAICNPPKQLKVGRPALQVANARRLTPPRAANSQPDVPPNVQEARSWIANWKEKQSKHSAPGLKLEDEQIRKGIEIQLRKSLTKARRLGTNAGVGSIAAEAKQEAAIIVEAINAEPTQDSAEVLRSLRDRVPLLSDEQVAAAIQLQLQRSGRSPNGKPPAGASTAPDAPETKATLAPSRTFDDGTILFSADQLSSVGYNDVNLKS